jgi:type IV secretion system protein VirD4
VSATRRGHPDGRRPARRGSVWRQTTMPAGRQMAFPIGEATLAVLVVLVAWVWLTGELAAWLASGSWPRVNAMEAVQVALRLPSNASDPRLAWPPPVRGTLPGPAALDGCGAALLAVLAGLIAFGQWLNSSRRPHDSRLHIRVARGAARAPSRGARWAAPPDLRPLRVRRACRGRVVLGRFKGLRRPLVATESSHSVLVLGPTQSGKTSGLAIPALLEWEGVVVATSVKDDLARATITWRSTRGPCWVFDPTASTALSCRASWSPLAACGDWSAAQRLASWMVEAAPARSGLSDAAFWYSTAAKQLAPLLLAAERGALAMADVVRWTNQDSLDEARTLLELAGEHDAALALQACAARDERIRSSVTTTLETVLAPFEDPVVATSTASCDIDLEVLLAAGGSLYLCGPSHEQHRVQTLFATLVSVVVDAALRRVHETGRPLDPPLLVVLDEAANIAPVRDLDSLASTGAAAGIQLVTVCQDLAQLVARYGAERARTIANNHRAKLVLSGVSDLSTLDLVSGLAGEQAVTQETLTHDLGDGRRTRSLALAYRRLAPTEELRCVPPGEAVLVYGHLPPARLRLRPWYDDRELSLRSLGPT